MPLQPVYLLSAHYLYARAICRYKNNIRQHSSRYVRLELTRSKMEWQGRALLRLSWLFFLFTFTCANKPANSTEVDTNVTCERNHEYDSLDIKSVTGKWRVVELYMHLSKEGIKKYPTCPKITVWETEEIPHSTFGPSTEHQLYHVQSIMAKFNQQHRHLRLLWDENGHMTEYSLFFRNESAGYWETFDKQNGSLASRPHYQQFSGTVQVLKAVKDHLVLNFCQAASNGAPPQLYSVLFSRQPGTMPQWEISAVHSLLQNKNLSIASRRMVCGNGASKPIFSLFFSFISCVLAYVSLS